MIWPYYKKRKFGRLIIAMEINLKEKRERRRPMMRLTNYIEI